MRLLIPFLFLWLSPFASVHAQGESTPQTQAEHQSDLEEARVKLEALKDDVSGDAKAWRVAYQERIKLIEELRSTLSAHEALESEEVLEARRKELERELADLKAEDPQTSVHLETPDDLAPFEQAAKAAKAEESSAASTLTALTTKHSEAEAELAGLTDRTARANRRVENLTGDDDVSRYRVESAHLETRVVLERVTFLTEGFTVWKAQEGTLEVELELATLRALRLAAVFDLAATRAVELREQEAQKAREQADREARRAELERDPIQRFRLKARSEAGNLRATSKSFETEIERLEGSENDQRAERADLDNERDSLDIRLRLRPNDVEALLRGHLKRCQQQMRLIDEVTLAEVYGDDEENHIELAAVMDRLWNLRLPAGENEELSRFLDEVDEARHEEATAAFEASLKEDDLLDALGERKRQLDKATGINARILAVINKRQQTLEEFESYIEGKMLWTPSDDPVNARSLGKVFGELGRLPQPYREDGTWSRIKENLGSRFPVPLIAAALVALLFYYSRKLNGWREFAASSAPPKRLLTDLVCGVSSALIPSLQLGIVAWALVLFGAPEAFDPPLSDLFLYQAYFLGARRLVRTLLGKGGLLVGPQGFLPAIGLQLVRCVSLATVFGQAFYAPSLVLAAEPFRFEVLPRILDAIWTLGAAMSVLLLVRRNGALVQNWTIAGGFLRPILRFLVVLTTIALVPLFALDLAGYRVGVHRTLENSFKVFVALFLLGALFRLLERIGAHWAGRVERADTEDEAQLLRARGAGIRAVVRIGAYLIVLATAMLLMETFGIGLVLSKLLVDQQLLELQPGTWLTLWDVAVSILWLAFGHILASNLRMLADSLVNPFANADEGNTFAYLAILRYLILGGAYGAALLELGFSFEALGWLATAVSVGLGFGLQEIVANFISGLILLFERPIRVGDIVTIGTTSGRVNSIAMRATVITNWERQTIIVPNKKFVTEDLTNWTRADTIMRREVQVRVDYDSNIEHVVQILEEIVRAHSAVMEDPAPKVYFENFGVIGIEFRVLFYTAIDQGLSARSAINRQISERFAKEGIEIPTVKRPEEMLGAGPPTAAANPKP